MNLILCPIGNHIQLVGGWLIRTGASMLHRALATRLIVDAHYTVLDIGLSFERSTLFWLWDSYFILFLFLSRMFVTLLNRLFDCPRPSQTHALYSSYDMSRMFVTLHHLCKICGNRKSCYYAKVRILSVPD